MKSSKYALLIDFGSTFTKAISVDLQDERIIARAQSPSTVDSDITEGLEDVIRKLDDLNPGSIQYSYRLACSSAAGGLRMVTIGLVPELTAEAAKRAALGAGAKVIGVYSYRLTRADIQDLERSRPDIILLAGGTDGGDSEVITENARILSGCSIRAPVIVAGNRAAADQVAEILSSAGKEVIVTENVMPEIGVINVEKARSIIREVFIRRIVGAKGLKAAETMIDGILMPTPTAVMNAASLIAGGADGEEGFGDLVIVDIGGATTDVHSIAHGEPTEEGILKKGLPEPFIKRTVEGDLGVRHNASTILEADSEGSLKRLKISPEVLSRTIEELSRFPDRLPRSEKEKELDTELGRVAARVAMKRHAGTIRSSYGLQGEVFFQYGKDLRNVGSLIGTGGPLVFSTYPERILREALYSEDDPTSLRPKAPRLYLDARYILYGIGLLAEVEPLKALRMAKRYLVPLTP